MINGTIWQDLSHDFSIFTFEDAKVARADNTVEYGNNKYAFPK